MLRNITVILALVLIAVFGRADSNCSTYGCSETFKRESAQLDKALKGKTLTCTLKSKDKYMSGSFSLSVEDGGKGESAGRYAVLDSEKMTAGYSDSYIGQLSVGETIFMSFGDDGRIVAIISGSSFWVPTEKPDAKGCYVHASADVLGYGEFTPDGDSQSTVVADCCLH